MKKLTLLCFTVLIFTAQPGFAQHWHMALKRAEKTLQHATSKHPGSLEKILQENISRAQAVHNAFSRTDYFAPVFSRSSFAVKEPLGQYKTNMVYGWTLEENKQFISQRVIYERHIRQLLKDNHLFIHENQKTPVVPSTENLAALIPADKKYIFIGEYHNEKITRHIQDTLKAFALSHPDKKIIVFSEFTDEWGFEQAEGNPLFQQYISPLEEAGIAWVGLKEPCPLKMAVLSDEYNMPVQATLMGLKTRNAHWLTILQQWRKENPDALFVIHAGAAHVDYQEPFSVSTHFPAQETFVLHVIPFFKSFSQYAWDFFHHATNYIFYRPGLLRWKTPRTARLAGFDMQVILP